jgi:hypothetical protein
MTTLIAIFIIWFVISTVRIYKKSGSWKNWNPFEGSFLDYLGIIVGGIIVTITTLYLTIIYLP